MGTDLEIHDQTKMMYGASDPALQTIMKEGFLDVIFDTEDYPENKYNVFASIDFSFFLANIVSQMQLRHEMRTSCPAYQTEMLFE